MTTTATPETARHPAVFWWNTPGIGNLIGLGPLLAASRSWEAGLALGLASLLVICAGNLLSNLLGRGLSERLRLPACALLIAALVTAVDLLFRARWFDLYGEVGLYVPLIMTNGLILARAGSATGGAGGGRALGEGLVEGAGFVVLLTGIGAARELLGPALVVATLPAGALFLLAAIIALRQLRLLRPGTP
ncbi:MAG: Rnf-Nqr domain containing protein [Gammaproteobacteria bacterium]